MSFAVSIPSTSPFWATGTPTHRPHSSVRSSDPQERTRLFYVGRREVRASIFQSITPVLGASAPNLLLSTATVPSCPCQRRREALLA